MRTLIPFSSRIAARILAGAPLVVALVVRTAAAAPAEHPLEQKARVAIGLTDGRVQSITPPVKSGRGRPTVVPVQLGDAEVELELKPFSLRSAQFEVHVDEGGGRWRAAPVPAPNTWRGAIRGQPGSSVAASIRHGQLHASIRTPDGLAWAIEPLRRHVPDAAQSDHVAYRAQDVVNRGGQCGSHGPRHPAAAAGAALRGAINAPVAAVAPAADGGAEATLALAAAASLPSECDGLRIAQIAFDADFEFFQLNGSSTAETIDDIESILNGVDAIYNRDVGIGYEITTIIVRSTGDGDPYVGTNPDSLLDQFRIQWGADRLLSSFPRDTTHLMTGRNLDGSTIGLAFVGTICSTPSRAFGLSQSRFSFNFQRRLTLTAHELGHNWGACHCDESECAPTTPPDCDIMNSFVPSTPRNQFEAMTQQTIRDHLFFSGGCIEDRRLFVNGNVLLSGNGSESFPFKTVKEAADRVLPRGCILIAGPVHYPETLEAGRNSTIVAVGGGAEVGK